EAAGYARDNALPVILLTPDPEGLGKTSPFVFELGQDPSSTSGALVASLRTSGHDRIGAIGEATSTAPLNDVAASFACLPLPSPAAFGTVTAVVVLDGAYCDDELWGVARAARVSLAIGLGAADLGEVPGTTPTLAAGIFPVRRSEPRLRAWF